MADKINGKCADCRWYKENYGYCRFEPKGVVVQREDFCHNFDAKETSEFDEDMEKYIVLELAKTLKKTLDL